MTTRVTLELELEEARARVADLEQQLENFDPYPVGTILQLEDSVGAYGAYAIKQNTIVRNYHSYKASAKPTWALIFDDFSGSSYPSLAKMKRDYGHGRSWKVIHEPKGD